MSDSSSSTPLLDENKQHYHTMSQHLSSIPTEASIVSTNIITSTPNQSDIESVKDERRKEIDDPRNLSSAGYSSMDDRVSDLDPICQSEEDLSTGI